MTTSSRNLRLWGNSIGVTLPADALKSVGLIMDDAVEVLTEGTRIIIQKAPVAEPTLVELLAQITPEMLAEDGANRDWVNEAPVGKEAF